MARTNKYSSLNFNDIYEKKLPTTSSPSSLSKSPSSSFSSAKSYSSSARLGHGGMLVLSRPSPKPSLSPLPSPPSPSPLSPSPHNHYPSLATPPSTPPSKSSDSDSISLRPQGKTGSGPEKELTKEGSTPSVAALPKTTGKFVPPHLRPGYVAREQAPVPPPPRPANYRPGSGHGHHGSPGRYAEDGRPKSGGGYDRRVRGVEPPPPDSDLLDFDHRPKSGGGRPNSSGR